MLVAPLGWVGFQAGLMVQIWDGLYGWGHVFTLTLAFAGIMILNNLLGFTGISVFARYLVTPLIILWVIYMVIKAVTTDSGKLGGTPAGTGLPVLGGRRGRDRLRDVGERARRLALRQAELLVAAAVVHLRGLLVRALHRRGLDDGPARAARPTPRRSSAFIATHYSLFGAFWLAWILATISQFAINDGNYYESVNAGQNLIGAWRHWQRLANVSGRCRRRRDRRLARQLPLHQRLVQGGRLPCRHACPARR